MAEGWEDWGEVGLDGVRLEMAAGVIVFGWVG